jgi:drug/metabolite transporter (DMT)-like permease
VGLGGTTLALTGLGIGAETAGPAVTAVLINSAPFFAVLMARIALQEKVKFLRGLGLAIGFVGVVVIVLSDPGSVGSGAEFIFGIAAVLVGAIGHATASVLVRWMSVQEVETELWGFTTAQFICGAVLTIPAVIFVGDAGATDWSAPTLWFCLAFLGIGSQLIAFAFFFIALSRWTSGRVMAWSFLPPVVAAVIEIARGNVPGTLTLIGMAIAIIGVAIVNHPRAEDIPVPSGDIEEHIT